MQYWPKGTPVHRQKGQKTRISPYKRTIAHAELLAVICWVSKSSIMQYFYNRKLVLSNPWAVRKFLEERLEKFGNLQWESKKKKTDYKFKEEELPIQWPTYPTQLG